MRIKVLLLGMTQECSQIQRCLKDDDIVVVGTVNDETSVLDEINRTSPDLILITNTSPMALRSCHQIYLLRPRSVPVIIADLNNSELLHKIIQVGVHYILPPQIEPLTLISELKGIYNNENNRILALENTGTASNKSKVLLIFGPKDGVGKTTLAVNLAVKLAQKGNKVVVLDYNLQFGDVGALFGVDTKTTILELLEEQSNPNSDMIRQFLALHLSGVSFLPVPHSPEYSNSITASQVERIISALRVHYDYVIVDTISGFDDISTACIDCASNIYFVTGKDIPALRNAKKCLTILLALADREKIKLIVGRDNHVSVTNSDISRVLGFPVWETIPSDEKAVISAINQGNPLVLENSKSKVSKVISNIANKLDASPVSDSKNKGKRKSLARRKGR